LHTPRIGKPEQFEVVREFLKRSNYREVRIAERLGMPFPGQLDLIALPHELADRLTAKDALDLLIGLFLIGTYTRVADAESKFSGVVWEAMKALGLIAEHPTDSTQCFATVALYPVGEIYIISDRWSNPDNSEMKSFPDIVYPALSPNTRELLSWLPVEPCDAFLEVCGGTGAAALQAAGLASRSCAADITPRATLFAAFNGALNEAGNFTSLQGDLYAPVQGQTFDRIAAHPPYVPVLRPADIYYGGGEDGEEIVRRLVQQLPEYLRPGGRFYCRTLGTDRTEGPFEKRVRDWLGEKQAEFDVAVFVGKNIEPFRYAIETAIRTGRGQAEVRDWKALFGYHHIQDLLIGLVLIERIEQPRRTFTIRRTFGAHRGREVVEWILRWERRMAQEDAIEMLLDAKPRTSPYMNLNIRHQVEEEELVPREFTLSTAYPFPLDSKLQPWMCSMICRCDGTRTIAELHSVCRESGWIHPDTPVEEFAKLAGILIGGGFLEVEEARLPVAGE
jgi:SAM-dependent methyltransferase